MDDPLFVLQPGIAWDDLPQKLGFGSGMTCWHRLRYWQAGGIWERLHLALLTRLRDHLLPIRRGCFVSRTKLLAT